VILPELVALAARGGLTPQERAALKLAITMLGGEADPVTIDEYALLPHKIEVIDGRLVLS
jgi:hypothetical protein